MKFFQCDRLWAQSLEGSGVMNKRQFVGAYLSHRNVLVYFILAVTLLIIGTHLATSPWQIVTATAFVWVLYPFVEFTIHRFVLHNRLLYRGRWSAKLWRRIHYSHHKEPSDYSVLLGALHTTIPTVVVFCLPIGYITSGLPGIMAGVSAGFVALLVYEFFHCAAHLPVRFESPVMQRLRRHHALHHFHAEDGNYGIVTRLVDGIFRTAYSSASKKPHSATVRNLGYCDDEVTRFPWVAMEERSLDAR